MTNNVITSDQAKQITGGRKPLTIASYEAAVKSLRECIAFDDTKYWSDLSDAAIAWAKINDDDEVMRLAKALKLEAARRVGAIAIRMRPKVQPLRDRGGFLGTSEGPQKLLQNQLGMNKMAANACVGLARMAKPDFNHAVRAASPPSPGQLYVRGTSGEWTKFKLYSHWGNFKLATSNKNASEAASLLKKESSKLISSARAEAEEMSEWLEVFVRCLPKNIK